MAYRANDFRAPLPNAEDEHELAKMPAELASILRQANGWLWHRGGFHVRGACRAIDWHSIARVWTGELALSTLFSNVQPTDVPFAQDAYGEQYLLRDGIVHQLHAESGDVETLELNLRDFLHRARNDEGDFLGLGRFFETCEKQGDLLGGQLVSVVPPFVMVSETYSLRRIPASERLHALSSLARQIASVPDGSQATIRIIE